MDKTRIKKPLALAAAKKTGAGPHQDKSRKILEDLELEEALSEQARRKRPAPLKEK